MTHILSISDKNKKTEIRKSGTPFFGPSVEIRTRGLLNPIQARYQTSPHPEICLRSLNA